MYRGMPYEKYFQDMDSVLQVYEARPHWGKMHNMNMDQLQRLYPKLEAFSRLRKQLDPTGLFLNAYFETLFAISNKGNVERLQNSVTFTS
ncbi:D-arabinono-1,4-lactone oxidase [Virgibacillus sp. Bac330]|uniref:D-arabinono-1,4-lactone oxidase n=1 Tax=Virgibacillus sp. Bac330 TaxID=2419841 RepID=UPI001F0937B8|nr:D-arabinono-1,4-lactone oxidase [Virgibacillus sp. Bac330]